MKNYTITVNGTSYDVTVEEKAAQGSGVQPKALHVQSKVEVPASTPVSGSPVLAPMPGKILSVKVSANQEVKQGDVLIVLEAMKMENEIVAPKDGVIASILVAAGDSVEAGAVLVSLN